MTRLTSVINESFINKLQGLQRGQGSKSSTPASLGGGGDVSITQTLRFGAKTFATGVQRLNSAISRLNVIESGLDSLLGLTESMFKLAQEASKANTGTSERVRLNREYQELGSSFLEVIEELNGQDVKYLTREGLVDIFQQVGLDPQDAQGIGEILSEFLFEGSEEGLISDEIKPLSGIALPRSTDSSSFVKVDKGLSGGTGGFSRFGTYFNALDDSNFSGGNPTQKSLIVRNYDGTYRGLNDQLTLDTELLGVQSENGNALLSSQENFVGYNTSGVNQVFTTDSDLSIVAQLTNNSNPNVEYKSASLSEDGLRGIVREYNTSTALSSIVLYERSTIDADPATATRTVLLAGLGSINFEPQINNTGSYVVYDNGTGGASLRSLDTGDTNTFLSGRNDIQKVVFTGEQSVGVLHGSSNYAVSLMEVDSGGYDLALETGLSGTSTIAGLSMGDMGYIGYIDNSDKLQVYNNNGNIKTSFDLSNVTVVNDLSLAVRGGGSQIVAGINGQFVGDTVNNLYQASSNKGEIKNVPEFDKLFGGESDILTRANSIGVMANLEAIRDRLIENKEALDGAKQVIGEHLDLIRSVGFAFLDLSNQITDEIEAQEVANELARRIRADASQAVKHADNLEFIVVAALTSDGSLSNEK